VWYNPAGITNIISLADAKKYFRVRYNNEQEKSFVVEKPDGSKHRFVKTAHSLYCFDMAMSVTEEEHGMALVTTVADNKSKYPVHTYHQALLAWKLQTMIGYPTTHDFLKIVEQNLIPNCPIRRTDILAAEDILVLHVDSLKGKMVRFGEQHVRSDLLTISCDILYLYWEVTLCIDIMYVNKIAFLTTISRHIKFATIELLANRQEDMIRKCVTNVMRLYGSVASLLT
jgi:hypothetical protein